MPIGTSPRRGSTSAGPASRAAYLGRAELTSARFIEDPFAASPGARLYRTGDRARWLASGELEYLGRLDQQVKIRGFRIELGEIEAGAPATRGDRRGRRAGPHRRQGFRRQAPLVAYLVLRGDATAPTVDDLRAFLRRRLPDAMVPAAFVLLEALPLNANGKVDRQALPAPEEASRPALGDEFVAPHDEIEAELARIWARVLRVEKVGARDNFFSIGGDSILSIQIVSAARAAGIFVTPRQIFQHQTIAELAAVAGSAGGAAVDQGPVVGTVPLTPIQRWWLERQPSAPSHYNQCALPPRVRDPRRRAGARRRRRHAPRSPRRAAAAARARRGGVAAVLRRTGGAAGDHPPRSRRRARGRSRREDRDGGSGGAGEPRPRSRARLPGPPPPPRGGPARAPPLRGAHHLAVDGVSWRILADDLWTAYAAARRGERAVLPPKTTSFQRWAERLGDRARSPELDAEVALWLAAGRRAAPRLPVDHERGPNTDASTRSGAGVAGGRGDGGAPARGPRRPTTPRSTTCS